MSKVEHTLTHELGHSFGALHDEESTGCTSMTNFIMANTSSPDGTHLFSECSLRQMEDFLCNATCLKPSKVATETTLGGTLDAESANKGDICNVKFHFQGKANEDSTYGSYLECYAIAVFFIAMTNELIFKYEPLRITSTVSYMWKDITAHFNSYDVPILETE